MSNKPSNVYIERLVSRLKEGVLFITIGDVHRPYTLNEEIIGQPIPEPDSDTSIKAWCLMHKEFEDLDRDSILNYETLDRDENYNLTSHDKSLDIVHKADAACCHKADCHDLSHHEVVDVYFNVRVDDDSFEALREINFVVTAQDVVSNEISEEKMSKVRDIWMDNIRAARAIAFEELDQLEEEAKSADGDDADLEDIEIIKQMFRDIPQDTDLSVYDNISDICKFWPALLLPAPSWTKGLDRLAEMIKLVHEPDSAVTQLNEILHNIHDIDFLQEILEDINNTAMTNSNDSLGLVAIEEIEERIETLQASTT